MIIGVIIVDVIFLEVEVFLIRIIFMWGVVWRIFGFGSVFLFVCFGDFVLIFCACRFFYLLYRIVYLMEVEGC